MRQAPYKYGIANRNRNVNARGWLTIDYGNGESFTAYFSANTNRFYQTWDLSNNQRRSGTIDTRQFEQRDKILVTNGTVTAFTGWGDDIVWVGDRTGQLNARLGDGDDLGIGGIKDDTIRGDNGNDDLFGNGGNDQLYGGAGDDEIFGNNGNDLLSGERGADWLNGGAGNDRIFGGWDNDTLISGSGNDILNGGLGSDLFVFNYSDFTSGTVSQDIIEDFSDQDRINLKGFSDVLGPDLMSKNSLRNQNGFALLSFNLQGDAKPDYSILVQGMSFNQFKNNVSTYLIL